MSSFNLKTSPLAWSRQDAHGHPRYRAACDRNTVQEEATLAIVDISFTVWSEIQRYRDTKAMVCEHAQKAMPTQHMQSQARISQISQEHYDCTSQHFSEWPPLLVPSRNKIGLYDKLFDSDTLSSLNHGLSVIKSNTINKVP